MQLEECFAHVLVLTSRYRALPYDSTGGTYSYRYVCGAGAIIGRGVCLAHDAIVGGELAALHPHLGWGQGRGRTRGHCAGTWTHVLGGYAIRCDRAANVGTTMV